MTPMPVPALPLLGRILMSAIFLASGAGKFAAPAGTLAMIRSAGLPLPEVSYAAATAVELLGGLLLIAAFGAGPVSLDARAGRA